MEPAQNTEKFNSSIYSNKEPEDLRISKKEVLNRFYKLKQENKLTKSELKSLLDNCNTIEEIIVFYLNLLKTTNDKEYINELISYYMIISPDECKNHKIKKKYGREIFHETMEYIFLEKENIFKKVYNEFTKCAEEVKDIFEEQTKNLSKIEKANIEKDYVRWNTIYNTKIDFKRNQN